MNEITIAFIEQFQTPGPSTTAQLRDAIEYALLARPQGGYVDSYAVADELFEQRVRLGRDADRQQTLDYVQHLFREASHVCRYADGQHHYFLHEQAQCFTDCNSRKHIVQSAQPFEARPLCPDCFIMLPCTGVCDCQQ